MKSVINKFYLFGFAIFIALCLGLIYQFNHYRNMLKTEMQQFTAQSRALLSSEIYSKLITNGQVIEDAGDYIATEIGDDNAKLTYFKKLMSNNPIYSSIYFGSIDNYMLNGSGWIPPKDFDLRKRPWYVKAIAEDKLIFTEAFINASKDKLVLTIAKPVYNNNNDLLGVVAGDVSIEDILNIVDSKKLKEKGYSFLLDGKGNILAHPNYEYNLSTKLKNINEISPELSGKLKDNKIGESKIILDGVPGYLAYEQIKNTDWSICIFIPKDVYFSNENEFIILFIIISVSSLIFIFALLWLIKKSFIVPMLLLDSDVKKINIGENTIYRIALDDKDPFSVVRKSINHVLDKTEDYFTQLQENERSLKETLERNKAIVNALPDLIFVVNKEGYFLDCQASNEGLFYMPKEDFIGKTLWQVMPKHIADAGYEKIQAAISTGLLQSFEYELQFSNELHTFELRMVKSADNEILAISRDTTEQSKIKQNLDFLSYHDELTGLYNRRYFEESLVSLDKKDNLPFTIIMGDVNGLKFINDSFGHKFGDELIKKAADAIKRACSSDAIVCRIGGDEFAVLLPKRDKLAADSIIKDIRKTCLNEKVAFLNLSISFGFETKIDGNQDIWQVFESADVSMYNKKLIEGPIIRRKNIETLLNVLHQKSEMERQHSKEVSLLCKEMGQLLNLSKKEIIDLENAGLLHDIGKIVVNKDALNKKDPLDKTEYEELKKHAEVGYRMLNILEDMTEVASVILYHHERWDGKGYPKGLKGEDIPLKSRILTITDSYTQIMRKSSCDNELKVKLAAEELKTNAGTQFDTNLTKLFVEKILGEEW